MRYIKLGEGGTWEEESIEHGQVLRLDCRKVPHDLCIQGACGEVLDVLREQRKNARVAAHDPTQIQLFYEAPADVLWVTFFGDRMYWCFSKPEITLLSDGSKTRSVIDCWRFHQYSWCAVARFRTQRQAPACAGISRNDLLRQRGRVHRSEDQRAHAARSGSSQNRTRELERTLEIIIRRLHWKDFEVLTDLIFRQAGWQRVSALGETLKNAGSHSGFTDHAERYGVQVNSTANRAEFERYRREFERMPDFSRFYFVVHTPSEDLARVPTDDRFELLLPKALFR